MYLDLVMAFNFLVDYLLLLGTNRLSGFPDDQKHILPAAFLGAVYSGLCMMNGFHFLSAFLWRTVFLGLIALMAFGMNWMAWKRCCMFLLLSFSLGGIAASVETKGITGWVICGLGLCCIIRVVFARGIDHQTYIPVEISNGEKSLKMIALRDTGNALRDPVSGEHVLVIGEGEARHLTGLTTQELQLPLETISSGKMPGLRLIPYQSVGKSSGFLLGMRFSDVRLNGRAKSIIVAFSPTAVGSGFYQALAGGNMV